MTIHISQLETKIKELVKHIALDEKRALEDKKSGDEKLALVEKRIQDEQKE